MIRSKKWSKKGALSLFVINQQNYTFHRMFLSYAPVFSKVSVVFHASHRIRVTGTPTNVSAKGIAKTVQKVWFMNV